MFQVPSFWIWVQLRHRNLWRAWQLQWTKWIDFTIFRGLSQALGLFLLWLESCKTSRLVWGLNHPFSDIIMILDEKLTGAFYAGNEGMIHWLTINNHPSNPQQPIQQPYVKRTSFAPMVQKSRNSTAPSCMVSDPSRFMGNPHIFYRKILGKWMDCSHPLTTGASSNWISVDYPLVMTNVAMENHHVQ